MMTSNWLVTSTTTQDLRWGFRASAVPELDAEATTRREADDVVVRTPDRAGPALHAVPEADDRLLLLLVPLVHPRRAEEVAVLSRAPVPAHVLVRDLDVRVPCVL